jgi:hypothetical protein
MKYKLRTRAKLKIVEKILKFVKNNHMENEISQDFFLEYMALLNMYKPNQVSFKALTPYLGLGRTEIEQVSTD